MSLSNSKALTVTSTKWLINRQISRLLSTAVMSLSPQWSLVLPTTVNLLISAVISLTTVVTNVRLAHE